MFMCIYPLLLGWMMMKTGIKYLKLIAFHTHISAPLSGQVWAIVSPIMTRHQHFSQVNNPALGENSNISLLQSTQSTARWRGPDLEKLVGVWS